MRRLQRPFIYRFESEISKKYVNTLRDDYPESSEEINVNLSCATMDELAVTTFVDSNHAQDKLTRCSVTGMIILWGERPSSFQAINWGPTKPLPIVPNSEQ